MWVTGIIQRESTNYFRSLQNGLTLLLNQNRETKQKTERKTEGERNPPGPPGGPRGRPSPLTSSLVVFLLPVGRSEHARTRGALHLLLRAGGRPFVLIRATETPSSFPLTSPNSLVPPSLSSPAPRAARAPPRARHSRTRSHHR